MSSQIKIFVHMLIEIIINFHWLRFSCVRHSYKKNHYTTVDFWYACQETNNMSVVV